MANFERKGAQFLHQNKQHLAVQLLVPLVAEARNPLTAQGWEVGEPDFANIQLESKAGAAYLRVRMPFGFPGEPPNYGVEAILWFFRGKVALQLRIMAINEDVVQDDKRMTTRTLVSAPYEWDSLSAPLEYFSEWMYQHGGSTLLAKVPEFCDQVSVDLVP